MVRRMVDGISVEQSATMASNVSQIAVQNIGMQPQEACQLALNLFMDNFPKLQQIAEETAQKRVEEFCRTVINKLQHANVKDYSPFTDPDVQYSLLDAQKNYARFGTNEMLDTLTNLVAHRVTSADDFILKVTIDKAISVASMLTPAQLDFLTLLFLCTRVKHTYIHTLEDLEAYLLRMCKVFPTTKNYSTIIYLAMHGCVQIALPRPVETLAKTYGFSKEDVERICPQQVKDLRSDYGVSPVGIILAITNAEQKTSFVFDPHIWIHE